MTFAVNLLPAAERQLRRFDPQVRRRIQAAIDLLLRLYHLILFSHDHIA